MQNVYYTCILSCPIISWTLFINPVTPCEGPDLQVGNHTAFKTKSSELGVHGLLCIYCGCPWHEKVWEPLSQEIICLNENINYQHGLMDMTVKSEMWNISTHFLYRIEDVMLQTNKQTNTFMCLGNLQGPVNIIKSNFQTHSRKEKSKSQEKFCSGSKLLLEHY